MKYIRVILAVEDNNEVEARMSLDFFIESDNNVQGAYVSGAYDTRAEAIGSNFLDDPAFKE